jgi:hypothetical protein
MNQNILNSSVLYYPNIEFIDDTWVKSTLCIWDKIFRIVPPSYEPYNSDNIKEAIDSGLIEDIKISTDDLADTATKFEAFWKSVPIIPAGVEGWEGVDVRLHPEKVDARILPILQELSKKVDPGGWLQLSPQVANTYMLFLSESISRRRKLPKLTDSSDMFSIMHYFSNEGNMDEYIYDREGSEATTSMVLTTLLPGGLDFTPMKKVIDFHTKSTEGRTLFRNSVMEFSEQVSQVEDTDYAQSLILDFQNSLKKSEQSILQTIGQSISDAKAAALSIGLPTTLTAIGALAGGSAGDPFSLWKLGGAGFIGAVATLSDVVRNRRNGWSANESSYYLQLNDVFKDKDNHIKLNITKYDRLLEEFIND